MLLSLFKTVEQMAESAKTRREETLDRENSGSAGGTAKVGRESKEHMLQIRGTLDEKKGEAGG